VSSDAARFADALARARSRRLDRLRKGADRAAAEADALAELERAEALAASASECFALADAAIEEGVAPPPVARRALDRAAALAAREPAPPRLRAEIATAYIDWFADEAAAAAAGPLDLAPEDLRPRRAPAGRDDASPSALLDWLRARVTPANLARIAAADRGEDADAHRAALERICASGRVPPELGWIPGEVVSLIRWSAGDGEAHHLERALACALLCLAVEGDDLAATAPRLVESCLALGPDAADGAARLLAWCAETAAPAAAEAARRALADPRLGR
jgi:hypothetical protein